MKVGYMGDDIEKSSVKPRESTTTSSSSTHFEKGPIVYQNFVHFNEKIVCTQTNFYVAYDRCYSEEIIENYTPPEQKQNAPLESVSIRNKDETDSTNTA